MVSEVPAEVREEISAEREEISAELEGALNPGAVLGSGVEVKRVRCELLLTTAVQSRVKLNRATVAEYADALKRKETLPPVRAFQDESGGVWLWDGGHRLEATVSLGEKTILVEVQRGSRRDAVLAAAGANAEHGLPRTCADKRRAVESLLADPEWQKWTAREIARAARVSHTFVNQILAEREQTGNVSTPKQERPQKPKSRSLAEFQQPAPEPQEGPQESAGDLFQIPPSEEPAQDIVLFQAADEGLEGVEAKAPELLDLVILPSGRHSHAVDWGAVGSALTQIQSALSELSNWDALRPQLKVLHAALDTLGTD